MSAHATCSRFATPDSVLDDDLYHFDWSSLDTHPSNLDKPFPGARTDRYLQISCTKKLRGLDEAPDKPEGLTHLISGTRAIIAQKWKTVLVYFEHDKDYPNYVRLWSHTVWKKWNVVDFLTGICCKYHAEVVKARKDGVELVTKKVDREYLALAGHIAELRTAGEKVITIKEWERPGTKLTMESRSLVVEDIEEDERENKDEDDEDDEDPPVRNRSECVKMDLDAEAEEYRLERVRSADCIASETSLPMRHR